MNENAETSPEPVSIREECLRIMKQPLSETLRVRKVAISKLHTELGFETPLDYQPPEDDGTFEQWRMETHDAPVLRYIFRNFQPIRHLEFGTGQGTSALYCLEECDATVFTINNPGGTIEKDSKRPLYPFRPEDMEGVSRWGELLHCEVKEGAASDIKPFIGRCYIQKGFGHRVCQIYCDSIDWDITAYPRGFFDTAFVDGGKYHQAFINDTKKSFSLVRSGGLILWYDFFIPLSNEKVKIDNPISRHLISKQYWIEPYVSKMFWVYPSRILIGVCR